MRRRHPLFAFAGILALAAWALFILACTGWPGWSSDSTKVVFPYADAVTKQDGVALYDRTTGSVTTVFRLASKEGETSPFAQFSADGKLLLIGSIATDGSDVTRFHLLTLPLAPGGVPRQFVLPKVEDSMPYQPYPEIGGKLFIGTEYIASLDLASGALKVQPLSETLPASASRQVFLFASGGKLYSVLVDSPEQGGDAQKKYQLGEVDLGTLKIQPWFTVTAADLAARGLTDAGWMPAADPTSARMAMSARREDGSSVVVFLSHDGLDRVLVPAITKDYTLGDFFQWSADGKTLYAPVLLRAQARGLYDYAVAEIDAASGATRLDPVARLSERGDWAGAFGLSLRVSLSPDGRTLATSTSYLPAEAVADTDRGLFLIALTDPARQTTKALAPVTPGPGPKTTTVLPPAPPKASGDQPSLPEPPKH